MTPDEARHIRTLLDVAVAAHPTPTQASVQVIEAIHDLTYSLLRYLATAPDGMADPIAHATNCPNVPWEEALQGVLEGRHA